MRRVVITGVGLKTPLGSTPSELLDRVLAGESAVEHVAEWSDVADLATRLATRVKDFDGREIPRKFRRTMSRMGQLAAVAAQQAVADAGLPEETVQSLRTGVAVSSTAGSAAAMESFFGDYLESRSARLVKATMFFQVMSHTTAANVALLLGARGEMLSPNVACASATQSIGLAFDRLRLGRADVFIVGGSEEMHPVAAITFAGVQAASTGFEDRPQDTPRPFDAERDGIVVGEGAGILVLETLEHAQARGATILGEVVGFATTCDAAHMSTPEPDGMEACMRLALADAGITPGEVDYINAHATGTVVGDRAEAEATHRVFGDAVPVSSTKGHMGHLLGACGSVEAALCLEAMKRGVLPPTKNLVQSDTAPLDFITEPRTAKVRTVLSNNFAFGGVNTSLVLRAFED